MTARKIIGSLCRPFGSRLSLQMPGALHSARRQAGPLYLDGMHAKENRARTLDAYEFGRATELVAKSSVDGMGVLHLGRLPSPTAGSARQLAG